MSELPHGGGGCSKLHIGFLLIAVSVYYVLYLHGDEITWGARVGMWRRVGVCVDVAGWTFGSVDGGCVDVDRGCLYILYCICTGVGIFVRARVDVWGRLLACVCERGGHLRVAGYGVKNVDRGAISIKITGIYKHRYIGILPIHPPLDA